MELDLTLDLRQIIKLVNLSTNQDLAIAILDNKVEEYLKSLPKIGDSIIDPTNENQKGIVSKIFIDSNRLEYDYNSIEDRYAKESETDAYSQSNTRYGKNTEYCVPVKIEISSTNIVDINRIIRIK
jgi:hypothetical protein